MKRIDRKGERYGRLLVMEHVPNAPGAKDTNARWLCQCDCGRTSVVYGQDLKRGKVVSCGCWNTEKRIKHGMARSHVNVVFRVMHDRCGNPKNPSFHNYGGRGIKVCERWKSFTNFISDMGDRPDGYQIDRIDNNGDYAPENCQWTTPKRQQNNRRNNRLLEFKGESKSLSDWADTYSLKWDTLRSRLRYGWSLERALTEPVQVTSSKE